jgi:hypothetical protein
MEKSKPEWTLYQARSFIKLLADDLSAVGYAVGLTGLVLIDGEGHHDLDLILYPMDSTMTDRGVLKARLAHCGLKQVADMERVHSVWRKKGSTDMKHVEVWLWNDKRIDFFFLE